MRFALTVLGANSATPMPGRFPSSFVLNHHETLFLIDCGEGAQIKMSEFGIRRSRIDHVFISHLHGDHIFGLPGFINSYNLNNRTRPLYLYGPAGLSQFVNHIIDSTRARLSFELVFEEIQGKQYRKILDLPLLEVFAFPLVHRMPTYAYKFVEKHKPLNIRPEAIEKWSMSFAEIQEVKSGGDLLRNGQVITNGQLVLPPANRRSFVYCSDTMFTKTIIPYIQGCDLMYHEATYLHDLAKKARERMHSTAYEAAEIASLGRVKSLLIGHYSSRYKDLQPLLEEARSVFEHSYLATEGSVHHIGTALAVKPHQTPSSKPQD